MIEIANPQKPKSREIRAAELWAMGYKARQIAAEMSISIRTVESHMQHFYQNTGCEDRADAFRWFYKKIWSMGQSMGAVTLCHSFDSDGQHYISTLPFDTDIKITLGSEEK